MAEGGTLAADDADGSVGDDSDDGVLVNDTDADDDPLIAILISDLAHGTVSFSEDGTFTYEHDGSETTADGFTYRVNDGTSNSQVAAVSITVTPVNDVPTAVDDGYTVVEGGTLAADDADGTVGDASDDGVLANDADAEGDPLIATLISDVAHGALSLNADGTFTYEHDGSETTFDSFTYVANDGQADSQEVTVSITVEAVNEVPSAADDDGFRVDTGETLTVDAPGILANDVDGDGDPLVALLVDGPSHGTLALEIDGSFTYTPDADFSGVDGFTYRANDGQADSNQATVTITVDQSLGTIDFVRRSDLLPLTGDKWFRFSAFRDGVLTAELTAEAFVPDAEITLYADGGGDLQELASGPTRIDYDQAVGGQQYALRVADVQSGVDLVLANLVQISPDGSQVTVYGTEGDDTFEAPAGVPRVMIVNGVRYESDVAASLQIIGGDGSDVATLTGSQADEVAQLHPNSGTLTGPDYEIQWIDISALTLDGGGGTDQVQLFDSAGDDHFVGAPNFGEMSGESYTNRAESFGDVRAIVNAGGFDVARLYDSTGDDTFYASPGEATLSGEGFSIRVDSFDAVHAFATAGGVDEARLDDSAGDDSFYASAVEGALFGDGFYNRGKFFERLVGHADAGGFDRAELFDSTGRDLFVGAPGYAALSGYRFDNQAQGFDDVQAYATAGGLDSAKLYDSPGDDLFVGTPTFGALSGEGFHNATWFFDNVYAYATAGGYDVATLYDSVADDLFYADPLHGALYRPGDYYNRAMFFEGVHAYATAGGFDVAELHGSDGDDVFYADPSQGALFRPDVYYNRAKFFEEVYADAREGDHDQAFLFDSPSVDLLEADGNWVRLSNQALDFLFEARAFDYAKPTAGQLGSNNQNVPSDLSILDFELDLTDW